MDVLGHPELLIQTWEDMAGFLYTAETQNKSKIIQENGVKTWQDAGSEEDRSQRIL